MFIDELRNKYDSEGNEYIDAIIQLYHVQKYVLGNDPNLDLTKFNRAFLNMLGTPEGKAAVDRTVEINRELLAE